MHIKGRRSLWDRAHVTQYLDWGPTISLEESSQVKLSLLVDFMALYFTKTSPSGIQGETRGGR